MTPPPSAATNHPASGTLVLDRAARPTPPVGPLAKARWSAVMIKQKENLGTYLSAVLVILFALGLLALLIAALFR